MKNCQKQIDEINEFLDKFMKLDTEYRKHDKAFGGNIIKQFEEILEEIKRLHAKSDALDDWVKTVNDLVTLMAKKELKKSQRKKKEK